MEHRSPMGPTLPPEDENDRGIEPVYVAIGKRLRALRRARKLKQAEMAAVIDISGQQYQKYEDGLSRCTLANLMKLADYLGVEVNSLWQEIRRGTSEPLRGMAEGPVAELLPDTVEAQSETSILGNAEAQLSRFTTAFLAIKDDTARHHLLGLAEKLSALPTD